MKRKNKKAAIAVVLGTRPEIIKLSALIRLLEKRRKKYFLLHTGQHYSYRMDRLFFKELQLPEPKYQLSLPQGPASMRDVPGMLGKVEAVLLKERPGAVVVQGDTNTVLAGALAASKIQGVSVAHVEAGLRSYDRQMPEETNRLVCDHISDLLFAPTPKAARILRSEGAAGKIYMTGNTIVDAVHRNLALARRKKTATKRASYFLLTLHRQENVDNKQCLASILEGLRRVHAKFRAPILFPVHPRTAMRLKEFRLRLPEGVKAQEPAGFLDFLRLEADAALALTDSGGVQEEACILRVPCVTLRTTTERPETVEVGANVIAGFRPEDIVRASEKMLRKKRDWRNPFGDGKASERILSVLDKEMG